MSTRESIYHAEDREHRVCHVYWEMRDRVLRDGRVVGAPMHIEFETGQKTVNFKLPPDVARRLCELFELRINFEII